MAFMSAEGQARIGVQRGLQDKFTRITSIFRKPEIQSSITQQEKIKELRQTRGNLADLQERRQIYELEVRREVEIPHTLLSPDGTARIAVTTLRTGDWWVIKATGEGKELGIAVFKTHDKDAALQATQAFMDDSLDQASYTELDSETINTKGEIVDVVKVNKERFSKRIYTVKPPRF